MIFFTVKSSEKHVRFKFDPPVSKIHFAELFGKGYRSGASYSNETVFQKFYIRNSFR